MFYFKWSLFSFLRVLQAYSYLNLACLAAGYASFADRIHPLFYWNDDQL